MGLLDLARRDVKANVLPAVTEHIVRMLERQAKVLDELDVDLMMMLYGGMAQITFCHVWRSSWDSYKLHA